MTLRQQFRAVAAEVWRIAQVKPWLVLWPVAALAWLWRNDPDAPWWLRFEASSRAAAIMSTREGRAAVRYALDHEGEYEPVDVDVLLSEDPRPGDDAA